MSKSPVRHLMDHNGNWVLQISYGEDRISNSCSLKCSFSFQQDMEETRKRVCGINPCQLDLISYCSLFCIGRPFKWRVYFSSIAALFHSPLFHFFPRTVSHSHLLCGITPLSLCGHANDTGGISQEECLNSGKMREQICLQLLQSSSRWLCDAWARGSVYLHEATEMEEGKAVMAAYPVCGFSISEFPT